ncbi:MAG TPA: hypothetical protein VK607_06550 [Kofleriaceae bacterium]|nr:hypothetical protein [Kofleriaceae bacterium]
MLVRTIAGLFMVVGMATLGCGGGAGDGLSPRAACEDIQVSVCERLYACFTPSELGAAGYPSSEAACVTQLEAQEGCAAQNNDNACEGNERFHADQAGICVDQIGGLECSQVRNVNRSLALDAPACAKMCAID